MLMKADFGDEAARYVMKIHPTMWTVYGNTKDFDIVNHKKVLPDIVPMNPKFDTRTISTSGAPTGKKMPLYFVSKTNFVEVEHAANIPNDIRTQCPPFFIDIIPTEIHTCHIKIRLASEQSL